MRDANQRRGTTLEDRDRDERRIVALRKTLQSFADASRRDQGAQSQQEHAEAVLEAEALRRVAWAVTSDEDDEADPATG
jgi:hypothetical protein